MPSQFLKRLYNISIYAIGFCVLFTATFATLVRVLLPDLGMYRSEVEAWVSNYMNLPVVIHSINANWDGWTPQLYLEQIDLLNSTGTDPIINFSSAELRIDLINSLLKRQIIPEKLIISGLDISVSRRFDGSIELVGMKTNNTRQNGYADNELGTWFLNQNVIELQHANINWHDTQLNQPPLQLTNVSLTLISDGNRLQVKGSTSLPDELGKDMNFAIDVKGNILSTNWSADLFIEANNIVPDKWYKQYWPKEIFLSEGNASISLWTTLSNTKVNSFHGNLAYQNLSIFSNDTHVIDIKNFIAEFSGEKKSPDLWLIDVQIDELITQNGAWPRSDLSVLAREVNDRKRVNLEMNFSYLKLADLASVIAAIPDLKSSTINQLNHDYVTGKLLDGKISFNALANSEEELQFEFNFQAVNTDLLKIEPKISELSGRFSGNLFKGNVFFNNDSALIKHLKGSDKISLNGKILWDKNENNITLSAERLILKNENFQSNLSGTITKSPQKTFVDVVLDINADDIQTVIRYMPYSSSFRPRDWLIKSIPSAKLSDFTLLMRGDTANFPFDDKNGQFSVSANINDATLEYSSLFPPIHDIDAKVDIQGQTMQINVESGSIINSEILLAKATIPDLFSSKKTLGLTGNIKGKPADLKSFISNSPLSKNEILAKINETLSPNGDMELNLELSIPIRNPERKLQYSGSLNLEKAEIVSEISKIELTNLSGQVHFNESSIDADAMSAYFDDKEISLSISGTKDSSENPAKIIIRGNADRDFISKQLETYFPEFSELNDNFIQKITGSTNWEATLLYEKNPSNNDIDKSLQIKSDMIGMSVDLPPPFTKKDYENINLEINKGFDVDSRSYATLSYGDFNSEFKFQSGDITKLQNINILLGKSENFSKNNSGINIVGNLQYLNINDWLDIMSINDKSRNNSDALPINIDLMIDVLEYQGQSFPSLSLKADNFKSNWNMFVSSPNIYGNILLSKFDDGTNHLIADLDTIVLKSSSVDKKGLANPDSLPSMLIKIKSFKYDEMDLGSLNLTAVPTNNGLLIENVNFKKPNFSIQASGKWNLNRYTGSASNFYINVHAVEFNKILETFGFSNDAVARSETKLIIDANWPGSPMNFSLEKLNGAISLNMEKGSLLDIEPTAGRLFGLLSLQTLPRRLVLDFSDLFGTGMAFDSISGNFSVNDGNAYTQDLSMKGPSVNIEIKGRTGLSNKDYDQTATVTPQISDSLAVASGFLGPVGIGLGAIMYLASNIFEKLENTINNIIKFEYSIKGSWDQPIVERSVPNIDS